MNTSFGRLSKGNIYIANTRKAKYARVYETKGTAASILKW